MEKRLKVEQSENCKKIRKNINDMLITKYLNKKYLRIQNMRRYFSITLWNSIKNIFAYKISKKKIV